MRKKLILILFLIFTTPFLFCEELLTATQAFDLIILPNTKQRHLLLHWEIAPGYYLYKAPLKIVHGQSNIELLPQHVLPKALTKSDDLLGTYEVYEQSLEITLPWMDDFTTDGFTLTYQGCAKQGFCYAPIVQQAIISPNGQVTLSDIDQLSTATSASSHQELQPDRILSLLQHSPLPVVLITFLFFGVLLTFTPCVLPMVPIVVHLITGPKTQLSTRRAISLVSSYVLSMALCYAMIGTVAGFIGNTLQGFFQTPWIILSFSGLLIVFALIQFGLFNLPFQQLGQQKIQSWQTLQHQGSLLGASIMGALSVLITSPCTTPALIGILTYISQDGNSVIGGLALFILGIGMGLPLIAVAWLGNRCLPKGGKWLQTTKILSGSLLIFLALWLAWRVMPTDGNTTNSSLAQEVIHSIPELNTLIKKAKQQQKPLIVDFYADWCTSCQRIEKVLSNDQEIEKVLKNILFIKADISQFGIEERALIQAYQVFGPPTFLFFDSQGELQPQYKLVGEFTKDTFLTTLKKINLNKD